MIVYLNAPQSEVKSHQTQLDINFIIRGKTDLLSAIVTLTTGSLMQHSSLFQFTNKMSVGNVPKETNVPQYNFTQVFPL